METGQERTWGAGGIHRKAVEPLRTNAAMQGRAKIVPPFRFGIVEAGVYRGAYPTLKNFPYLKTLELTTVISLTPEPPTVDLEDFCVINNINLQHYMGKHPTLPHLPPHSTLLSSRVR